MLVVGSKALKFTGLLPEGRKCMDTDIIGSYSEFKEYCSNLDIKSSVPSSDKSHQVVKTHDGRILEWEFTFEGTTAESLVKILGAEEGIHYADINTLLTLKSSHKFLKDSPHFYKTMADIKYLKGIGAVIPLKLIDWFKEREAATYTYKHPKLDTNKEDFFKDDEVPYIFDHDSIHLAVMVLERPAYTFFKPEENEVMCCKKMFDSQPDYVKLLSVVEESMVLALERSLIPYNFRSNQDERFKYALMKVCTSITSGWWRDWAWHNHDRALEMYHNLGKDYMRTNYKHAKHSGLLKPFKKEM